MIGDWKRLSVSLGLCLFAASVFFSVSLSEIGLGLIFLGLLAANWRLGFKTIAAKVWAAPLSLAWTVYLGAKVVSSLAGYNVAASLPSLASDIFKCAAFYLFYFSLKPENFERTARFYLAGAVAAAFLGIWQAAPAFFAGIPSRAEGTLNPVVYGYVLVFSLCLAASSLAFSKTAKERLAYAGAALILSAAIALSQTRGALVGFFAFCVSAAAVSKTARKPLSWAVPLCIAAMFAVYLSNADSRDRLVSIFSGGKAAIGNHETSADGAVTKRLAFWKTAVSVWQERPILGAGPENLTNLARLKNPGLMFAEKPPYNVHNLYLKHAAEGGILGLASLLFLLGAMLRLAWLGFRRNPNAYTLCAVGAVCAFCAMELTEILRAVVAFSILFLLALGQKAEVK